MLTLNLAFFASSAGYVWLETVDHYASGFNLIIFFLVQMVVLVYMLPLSDLETKINDYGERFPKLYDFCLKYVCPAFALFLSLTGVISELKRDHHFNNIPFAPQLSACSACM